VKVPVTRYVVNIRKVINRHFRRADNGVQAVGDVDAVISANVGEKGGSVSHTSSRQRSRVVQRSGKTVVSETHEETRDGSE
jgi:hypothetical protein